MAMVLDAEERMLKDAASGFFSEQAPIAQLRRLRNDRDLRGYDPATWAAMVDMGWSAMPWREEYGGLDFGFRGLGLVSEEMGRTLASTPLWSTVWLAGSLIMMLGNEQHKRDLLSDISAGTLLVAVALEESERHDLATVDTILRFDADGAFLTGQKSFVPDAAAAGMLIVLARTTGRAGGDSHVLLVVPPQAPGVSMTPVRMVDSRSMAAVRFDAVRIEPSAILGEVGPGDGRFDRAIDIARIGLAAEMIGVARECLSRTVAYIGQREQFGRRLSTFQSLRHRCAGMLCQLELASAVVRDALCAIDDGRSDVELARLASMAKAEAGEAARMTTREAIQMHGGIGMTDEFDIGFFMKRAAVVEQMLGTMGFHRDRYATLGGY